MERRRSTRAGIIGAGLLLCLGAVASTGTVVSAKGSDVVRRGDCSGSSTWKLKLSKEDGGIEVEAEIDTNRNGRTWAVTLRQDGDRFFAGQKVTKAPSGSFEVRRVRPNHAGTDTFKVHAVNHGTGEECNGTAAF